MAVWTLADGRLQAKIEGNIAPMEWVYVFETLKLQILKEQMKKGSDIDVGSLIKDMPNFNPRKVGVE